MTVQKYTFNPFQTNSFIVHDDDEAVIIDASAHVDDEFDLITDYVTANNLSVKYLLLTHAHIDHILGCARLSSEFGLPWHLNPADKVFIERAVDQARMFGIELDAREIETVPVREGDTIAFGSTSWDVIETPGHSPGSVSFVDRDNRFVVAGDVLFQGSIGRTDLWQGSMPVLMRSIYDKLLSLGDDYRVFCGHGPDTLIAHERATNPFLQG